MLKVVAALELEIIEVVLLQFPGTTWTRPSGRSATISRVDAGFGWRAAGRPAPGHQREYRRRAVEYRQVRQPELN